ncbi:Mce-associated membrane protein [Nocardioides sp. BE266]|uniref:J domain-containing protein n=1 Tax=Nocardioides sp. BE266 TaxID=2817725 RepID=UPI002863DBEB|nr:DnaJ domain-containing protein [Nocardioides sp. BE266]MDR7255574.1 Mce-associated membrane protein [Nocardioides sp. BE266]
MSDAPTWYDLLDVSRDASPDEVRAAWKTQIADLEPGDRRFDALNRAAKVLLDPEARAAYDASLPEEDAEDGTADVVPPVTASAPVLAEREQRAVARSSAGPRTVPSWLLAGLGILAAGLVAAVVWMWSAGGDGGDDSAARAAQVAAESAVVPVLSYDYQHLDEDQKAATSLMTGKYKAEYDKLFAVLQENAPQTQTKVIADVVASGIVRAAADRVQVLVFVDRPTTNKLSAEPTVYKDQVTLSMQLVDGEWLVDDLITSPVQG